MFLKKDLKNTLFFHLFVIIVVVYVKMNTTIIRKTKCFRILERNAIISKTKRNFSRLYPTPQKIKKNRPASPERNTFEGS